MININMRCIEITSSEVFEDGFNEININMRCIEIAFDSSLTSIS